MNRRYLITAQPNFAYNAIKKAVVSHKHPGFVAGALGDPVHALGNFEWNSIVGVVGRPAARIDCHY